MKKTLLLLCVGVLACTLSGAFSDLNAQTPAWDYPVKPGTPEWADLKTHKEKLAAIQIPEDVLHSLSTKDLVEICFNYPLVVDWYGYNSLQDGLKKNVAINFNGVRELFRRKDNVQCLLDRLKTNDLLELPRGVLGSFELSLMLFRQPFVEAMLSHESVIANADARQLKEIAVHAMRNTTIKENQPQLYEWFSMEASAYLLCATLTAMNGGAALSPDLGQFLEKGSMLGTFDAVDEMKRIYIKF